MRKERSDKIVARRCKRCNRMIPTSELRYSKVFKGFVCSDRIECSESLKSDKKEIVGDHFV